MSLKKHSPEELLVKAVKKTDDVKKELERAEDELIAAHAVLETKLAKAAHEADVETAVATTGVATQRVGKSAEDLKEVKEVLQEVKTRDSAKR
jgi:membrane-bound lytic murein transglycosylase MltF